jgi:hypothetical protein
MPFMTVCLNQIVLKDLATCVLPASVHRYELWNVENPVHISKFAFISLTQKDYSFDVVEKVYVYPENQIKLSVSKLHGKGKG